MRSSKQAYWKSSQFVGPKSRLRRRRLWTFPLCISAACLCLAGSSNAAENEPRQEEDFFERLDRVRETLRTNPHNASQMALESCNKRLQFAGTLYQAQYKVRAERSLAYCFDILGIPATAPRPERPEGPDMEAIAAEAGQEVEVALLLTPDVARGLEIYRDCALCHMPEGWGMKSGLVPQLAGQHRQVVIKQLADIRAGYRVSHMMLPYASA